MKDRTKNFHKIIYGFFLILIFLYPLRHVNVGVDLWDGGYNCANFRYHTLEYMDSMWFFATWLANMAGHFFTLLPFGDTLLGMNVYCSLLVSCMGAAAYIFCVKRCKLPTGLAAIGELVALCLCWAPVSALYNYLTYGFLLGAVLCLYHGLTAEKNVWLVLAGVILGLNVGNRFSNLVEMGLILAVWYYGFACKKSLSQIGRETLCCVLGYGAALGAFCALMAALYGFGSYVEGISQLFAMTEYATDYSAVSMLEGMVWAYYDSAYWLKRFGLIAGCGLAVSLMAERWGRIQKVLVGLVTLAGGLWLIQTGFLERDYATYNAIYSPCVMVFVMAICLALRQLGSGRYEREEKLQALLVLLLILLTSLGGNNAIYSSMNNLFLVFPWFLGMVRRFWQREGHAAALPCKGLLLLGIVFLIYQSLRFGQVFVYEEATGARMTDVEIEEIPVLAGMRTSRGKAEELQALYQFLQENALGEQKCILFGNIPGLSYYMELAPAINIWSDLRSYDMGRMREDLAEAGLLQRSQEAVCPLIILEARAVEYLEKDGATEHVWDPLAEEKLKLLGELMEDYEYRRIFYNEKYGVFSTNH